MNHKRHISDEQNERHKKILTALLKEEGNKQCADCRTRNPTWASVNLGVFVCLTCSGIHRSLGVHISQVRSCNLDTWLPKQVEFVKRMGNVKANKYWEARLAANFRRPEGGQPNPPLAKFIRDKYVDRKYAISDTEPPSIDNWETHPFVTATELPREEPKQLDASVSDAAGKVAMPSTHAQEVDLLGGFGDFESTPVSTAPVAAPTASMAPINASVNDLFTAFADTPSTTVAASSPAADWAAFDSVSCITPAVSAPPSAVASLPATTDQQSHHHDDLFGDFQGVEMFQGMSISPPAPMPAQAPSAVAGPDSSLVTTLTAFPVSFSASSATPASANSTQHKPGKSTEDILRLFDQPSSNQSFPAPSNQGIWPSTPASQGLGQTPVTSQYQASSTHPGAGHGVMPQQALAGHQLCSNLFAAHNMQSPQPSSLMQPAVANTVAQPAVASANFNNYQFKF